MPPKILLYILSVTYSGQIFLFNLAVPIPEQRPPSAYLQLAEGGWHTWGLVHIWE